MLYLKQFSLHRTEWQIDQEHVLYTRPVFEIQFNIYSKM
jgi:hypothetical protein